MDHDQNETAKNTERRALGRYRRVLRNSSLKCTRVREAIARAALGFDGHFSVNDLVRALRSSGIQGANASSVYRAMPLMIQAGLVAPTLTPTHEGQLYERAFERDHHDHMICRVCGAVVEYHSEALGRLQRQIAEQYDFELEGHVHELRGRCKDCRQISEARVRVAEAHSLESE
ncbi:MAG TPA: transcriptional repressor [Polyangiaceae bacterium]|nr:transcriptional repressor [Polyangiaceae bacterium]